MTIDDITEARINSVRQALLKRASLFREPCWISKKFKETRNARLDPETHLFTSELNLRLNKQFLLLSLSTALLATGLVASILFIFHSGYSGPSIVISIGLLLLNVVSMLTLSCNKQLSDSIEFEDEYEHVYLRSFCKDILTFKDFCNNHLVDPRSISDVLKMSANELQLIAHDVLIYFASIIESTGTTRMNEVYNFFLSYDLAKKGGYEYYVKRAKKLAEKA